MRTDLAYLDCAATTPLDEAVLEHMLPYLRQDFGNPSALHALGVRARAAVEEARERLARALTQRRCRVVFTSGGSEANNLAIRGFARTRRGDRIVCSTVEHPSAGKAAAVAAEETGKHLVLAQVDATGTLDLDAFATALTPSTALVVLMHTQNETGVVQPVAAAAALVRERAPLALVHVDAVQSLGKVPLDEVAAVADSIAFSAHKVHGPKGAGALILFTNASPKALLVGGGQELGLRAGTENVAGIAGFALAAERALAAQRKESARLHDLAARVGKALYALPDVRLLGERAPRRSPAVTAAAIGGVRGEILQHELERRGVIVGTGSACHAARHEVSQSLQAAGLDHAAARSMIRVSLSHHTRADEVARFEAELPAAVARIRELVA